MTGLRLIDRDPQRAHRLSTPELQAMLKGRIDARRLHLEQAQEAAEAEQAKVRISHVRTVARLAVAVFILCAAFLLLIEPVSGTGLLVALCLLGAATRLHMAERRAGG